MESHRIFFKLIPILYEDDQLLAVGKPAGIDVGRLDHVGTAFGLIDAIEDLCSRPRGTFEITNRLARFESGPLVLAKTPEMAYYIREGMKRHSVQQKYLMHLVGKMKKHRLQIRTEESISDQGKRLTARSKDVTVGGSSEIVRIDDGEHGTLAECKTTAENLHILRAQLRAAGLKVVGDPKAGATGKRVDKSDTKFHLVSFSFHHPVKEQRVTIHMPAPDWFKAVPHGKRTLEERLHLATVTRLEAMVDPATNAYRLLTGEAEGLAGAVVERFGPVIFLQQREGERRSIPIRKIANWYKQTFDVDAVYLKPFLKDRQKKQRDIEAILNSSEPFAGKPVEEEFSITESGIRYLIRPYDGYSVGLFLDQRGNRQRVKEMSGGGDMLNLFSYTCGFSVAAAMGGANSTTSVDISKKSLEWGKRNFFANGLELDNHLFFRAAAWDFLKRADRQDRSYDLIVLDAPSFAHGLKKSETFEFKRDLAELLRLCVRVLKKGGKLMLSTNNRQLTGKWLRQTLAENTLGRKSRVIGNPKLPVDFAVDPDHAKTLFVKYD